MNPALPSGVHQKALEVYAYIFLTFGRHFVSDHLDEFFPGLSSVLSFASLSVRPALYDILEEHIVPLPCADLRPLLKALVLSLLPALEEEASEDFERAFRILETLENKSTQTPATGSERAGFFWQCLFLAIITSPLRRQGALNYLAHKLPKFEQNVAEATQDRDSSGVNGTSTSMSKEAEAVVSPEPGLLVRAFVCGLSDTQLLIQRGFLDLLVTHLPLSSALLQARIRKDDLDRLITAAMHVLLRREMSLNRRLWSWFLGPDPKSERAESQPTSPVAQRGNDTESGANGQLRYFALYGKPPLERSVLTMFKRDYRNATERARPFRLCLSLMDRWEIGGSIVPEMFLPAIRSAYDYSLQASPAETAEVIRSSSLFFDSIEASLIWANILGLVDEAFDQSTNAVESLQLCKWIIESFNIKDEEMVTSHVPRCALAIVLYLEQSSDRPAHLSSLSLEIVTMLLDVVPGRALPTSTKTVPATDGLLESNKASLAVREAITRLYKPGPSTTEAALVVKAEDTTYALYRTIMSLTLRALQTANHFDLGQTVTLFSILLAKSPNLDFVRSSNFLQTALTLLREIMSESKPLTFPTTTSMIVLILALKTASDATPLVSAAELAQIESILTPEIWRYLSPHHIKYHVEATKALWQIHDLVASDRHLEATLTALVRPSRGKPSRTDHDAVEATRRFIVLWTHSISVQPQGSKHGPSHSTRRASTMPVTDVKQSVMRREVLTGPLMLLLDGLSDAQDPSHTVVKGWIHNLPTLEQVLAIHFELLQDADDGKVDVNGPDDTVVERDRVGVHRCLEHTLGHFRDMLKHGNERVSQCLDEMHLTGAATGLVALAKRCVTLICDGKLASRALEQTAIEIVGLILSGSHSDSLKPMDLDSMLIDRLLILLAEPWRDSQSSLLKLIQESLKLRSEAQMSDAAVERPQSRNSISSKRPSTAGFRQSQNASNVSLAPTPPAQLLTLIKKGFSSTAARPRMDKWLEFLSQVLPVFPDAIFAGLIPLVECFCKELQRTHSELIKASQTGYTESAMYAESTLMALLEAMEMILARAHQSLEEEEKAEPEQRPVTQSRGLLGNVTSGVFKSEGPSKRTSHANSRLSVILTFQDAIRVSLSLWIWGSNSTVVTDFDKSSAATTSYNALRIRNRTRHLLEQIFAVEPLESLEVVMSNWCSESNTDRAIASLNLLHVLQGTRPKNVIPAILDALCSRTNPSALTRDRLSTKTTDLTALNVAVFLTAYLRSTEDDAMDEIWPDCMAFLRDVLGNPLPYRHVLPALFLTVLLLAQKLENTNFGEQRKMRKELGDSFNRLLTAAFTTMPSGFAQDPRSSEESLNRSGKIAKSITNNSSSLIGALKEVSSNLEVILETADRATGAVNSISSNLIGPMFRAKSFPSNITPDSLVLLLQLSKKTPLAKSWRKELLDAFNDPRLLSSDVDVMERQWFPVLHQWCLHDKERMPELLSRLVPPSNAGIMFGVGANAARLEADRKTQLNLRRISILMLASPADTFALHLRLFNEKLAELFDATASSSPSVAVKAELFMLCRAICLSTSAVQLAPMWPIINDHLHAALASLLPIASKETSFVNLSLLQACKLLDLLITLSPDEFQLHEWLYITDNIDAVYQPLDWDPTALSDQIANGMTLDGIEERSSLVPPTPIASAQAGLRRPLLDSKSMSSRDDFRAMARDDFTHTVLRPFLSQLSMYAYETVYGMDTPDVEACRRNLLEDLLDLSTIVE